ncbi:MAG: hypothetical protein CVU42_13920 [Chloroflexi bacterium HGW-Chloroflexi-4]|jgi:hypothetical protein|nr:MAG: hypothetical protein CVU42_13920 [Chloroflexi bacterium HGW-Chloroflexi-4]
MAVDDSNTKILLHGDGADGSPTITDESGKTWTVYGNTQIDTAQSVFGGASIKFDGTGDYIQTPYHADFDLGADPCSGDLRVMFAAQPATNDASALYVIGREAANNDNVISLRYYDESGTKKLGFQARVGNVTKANYYFNWSATLNQWYHIEWDRDGSNFYIFIDGVSQSLTVGTAIGTNSITLAANLPCTIGRYGNYDGYYFNGWIDEDRALSKGVARHTANFTPPTSAYSAASSAIKKVTGQAYASIKKICGVAIASIKKVAGVQ